MVRYMADSIDWNQLPTSITIPGRGVQSISLACGYLGGSYQQSSHKGSVDVNIDVNGSHPEADVLDVEEGDATPDTAPGWVKEHNAKCSFPAILYCNRSNIHAIANACDNAGLVVGKDYFWWISTLDGSASVADMTGVLAVQAWGANYFPGHNIDVSVVYNDSWKNGGDMAALTAEDRKAIITDLMEWSFGPLLPGGDVLTYGMFLKAMANFLQNATGGDLRNLIALEQDEEQKLDALLSKPVQAVTVDALKQALSDPAVLANVAKVVNDEAARRMAPVKA